jgi:hypothetical protein
VATVPAVRTGQRRVKARRACVAVVSGLVAFAALQLGAAVVLERWFPAAIDPDYGGRFARLPGGLKAEADRPLTVVVLGSSHVYYGLQAEALQASLSQQLGRPVTVVNFGFAGAGGVSQLLMWNRMRRAGVRPDLVVVEAWPKALEEPYLPGDVGETRMPTGRLAWPDVSVLRRYRLDRPHLARDVALAEVTPFYSRRCWLIHAVAPELLPGSPETTSALLERLAPPPLPPLEQVPLWRETMRPALQSYVKTVTVGGRGYEALAELVRSCREVGVPAALMLIPEGPELRSWYGPGAWDPFQAWLEQLSRDAAAPIFNAREWIDDENDFLDSHHLLPSGAARFTERLGRDCILPALRQRTESRAVARKPD